MGKRTKLTRALILTFALVICLGMLFTSCGDDEGGTTVTTAPITQPTTTPTTAKPGTSTTDTSAPTTTDTSAPGTTDTSTPGTTDTSAPGTTDTSSNQPEDKPCTEHKGGVATCKKLALCEVCGEEYGELGAHDWAEATCQAAKTCNVCGETEGEPASHVGGTATCDKLAICNNCGEGYGVLAEHTWADATCEAPKTCTVCKETEGAALGHNGGEATCQALAVCETCGKGYGVFADCDYYTAEDAVEGTHFVITKQPTCVEKGEFAYKCTVCGDLAFTDPYVVEIPELKHDEQYEVVDSKCEVAGYTKVTCTRCELNETRDETPALQHVLKENVVAPKCGVAGYTEVTCEHGCAYYETKDPKEALTHTGGEAKCNALAVCDLCGEGYGEYEDHVEKEAATCTALAVCDVCGEGYGEMLPHTYDKSEESTAYEITLAPTCITEGTKAYKCTVCSTVSEDAENIVPVAATGVHSVSNDNDDYFVREFVATCVADGYKVYKCSLDAACTHEEQFETSKAHGNHVYDKEINVVEPTCSAEGYTTYACTAGDCGKTEDRDYTARTAHEFDFVENLEEFDAIYCTVCAQAYINIKTGVETKREGLCLGCCRCEAANNVECSCDPDAEECVCEAANNVECTCTCTCGVIVEWHGYTKPGDADAVTAGEAFTKDGMEIGNGLIKLVSAEEATYTIVIGDATIEVTGTEVIVDLYKYESVTSVTITSTVDATVVFYSVFEN